MNNIGTLIRSPTHNHVHSHPTIRHLSNINLSNVANTQRGHFSCCCYTCAGGSVPYVHIDGGGGTVHVEVRGNKHATVFNLLDRNL